MITLFGSPEKTERVRQEYYEKLNTFPEEERLNLKEQLDAILRHAETSEVVFTTSINYWLWQSFVDKRYYELMNA